jgi:UDP-glucose 4-epimerase
MQKLGAADFPAVGVTRREVDLLQAGAADRLASLLQAEDAVVVIAARAPAKNTAMLVENVQMMQAVCSALEAKPVAHVVYVSSDAVYADSEAPLSESSCAEPGSLHGAMHLAREVMLRAVFDGPLCILRPTLLYGAEDSHNGYGPNSFRRLAAAGKDLVLFGEGEERRDHVFVDDVADIIVRVLTHRSSGKLNVASGTVTSFREIAEKVVELSGGKSSITGLPRKGPMPHNGYRAFDPTATSAAFPDFQYTSLSTGLVRARDDDKPGAYKG